MKAHAIQPIQKDASLSLSDAAACHTHRAALHLLVVVTCDDDELVTAALLLCRFF